MQRRIISLYVRAPTPPMRQSLGSRRRSWAHRGRPRRRAVPIIITMRVRTEALKTLKSITAVEYTLCTTV